MNYILLGLSILVEIVKAVVYSFFSKNKERKSSDFHLMNFTSLLIAGLGLLPFASFDSAPSVFTVLLGMFFGGLTMAGSLAYMKALSVGPVSYTELINRSSMIIPAFSGAIFWNEDLNVWHIVAVALLLVCFVLSSSSKSDDKKANVRWIIFAFLSFAFTGSIGVTQKIQGNSDFSAESGWFLVIAMLTAALISAILWLYNTKGDFKEDRKEILKPKLWAMFIYIGFVIAFTNKINLYLSNAMPSIIFFPLINGGNLILIALAGFIIFKEKLSLKQSVGMIFGLGAVLLLCFA